MKFSEWWEKYKWNAGLEQGAYDAYNEGLKEGLRLAQVARSDTTQGGGSQTPAPVACRYPECGCRADLGEAWKACSTKGA